MSRSSLYISLLCGEVSYKFIEKSHVWPNRFSSTKFSRNEEILKAYLDSEERGPVQIQQNLSIRITPWSENFADGIGEDEIEEDENEKEEDEEEKGENKEKCATKIEEEITGPAFIDILNDISLIKIFSYLPMNERLKMEDVCVRWRDVGKKAWHNIRELDVQNPSLSRFLAINFHSEFIEKVLMRCGVYLNTLKLHLVSSSHILPVICEYCHNLTTIELAFTDINVKHFKALPKIANLHSFTLTEVEQDYEINCLLNFLPKTVKSIHIHAGNSLFRFFDKFLLTNITNILEEFNALDSLTMRKCLFRKDLTEALSEMETITKLDLASCRIEGGLNLLTNLSNLEHLNFGKVQEVDNNFLAELSTKCQKLKYLDVSYCEKLSDEGVKTLENLINLKVLLINMAKDVTSSISDLSLSYLKGIEKLECGNCIRVRDRGIMELIKNSPDLERLDVSGTSISEETLRLAISVTKDRENSVILCLFAELNRMNSDEERENDSPFLKFNDTSPPADFVYDYET